MRAVHLAEGFPAARRNSTLGRAYPIGEADRPVRTQDSPTELSTIIRYLDVERSARYQPTVKNTFCNIYACDYCYLAGVYLPRVWWTKGEAPIEYGVSVAEMNANALYVWLCERGADFGWQRSSSLDDLQEAANNGQVSVICAQRKVLTSAGHIALVVPESDELRADRVHDPVHRGSVHRPMQSQAGRRNFSSSTAPGRWWESPQFRAFGFWIHS